MTSQARPCGVIALLSLVGLAAALGGSDAYASQTITILKGVKDNYALPTESTSPSVGMRALHSGVIVGDYDNARGDLWLLESFSGLPTPVTGARLRVIVKPVNGLARNDALTLEIVDSTGARLHRMGLSYSTMLGRDFTPNNFPAGVTIDLDLSTVLDSAGVPFIDHINTYGRLDVASQDDGVFDCLELELEIDSEAEPCSGPAVNDSCANATMMSYPGLIAGRTHVSGSAGDTDWFGFDIASPQAVRAEVMASQDVNILMRGPGCAGPILAQRQITPAAPFAATPYLDIGAAAPATYLFQVQPGNASLSSCANPVEYQIKVEPAPGGGTPEPGSCTGDMNDGCDLPGVAMMLPIGPGQSRSGKAYGHPTQIALGDVDWYTFSVPIGTMTEWSLEADFDFGMQLLDVSGGCPGTVIYSRTQAAGKHTFEQWVPAGTYAVRIRPDELGLPCTNPGTYLLHFVRGYSNPTDPAIVVETVQAGRWDVASTWKGGLLPGPANSVIVRHAVRMTDSGSAPLCEAAALTVASGGEIRPAPSTDLTGVNMSIKSKALLVEAGGAIRGGDASAGLGGSVSITASNAAAGSVRNRGLIKGGDSANGRGGEVYIHAPSYVVENRMPAARIEAGTPSGNVTIVASQIENDAGTIRTGLASSLYPIGGTFRIWGTDWARNINGGLLEASSLNSSSFPDPDRNYFMAYHQLLLDGASKINCLTIGTRELCTAAQSVQLMGTITGNQTCHDPPVVELSGEVRLQGPDVLIAGELIHAHDLVHAEAVRADNTIVIQAAPGGVVDLSELASGTDWFKAGQAITIMADTVRTGAGVSLESLFDPDPVVRPGAPFINLCVNPASGEISAVPGELVVRYPTVINCGNAEATIDVTMSDTAGWLASTFALTGQGLGVMDSVPFEAAVQVPPDAEPGDSTTITFTATAPGTAASETVTMIVRVGEFECRADLNGDGIVDFGDYLEFLNLFAAQDPRVDFNGDGVVDFADYLEFLNLYEQGC